MDTELKSGDRVRLISIPPYFKTAEPMPMLRPPNVVELHEEGILLGREPGDTWRVRFNRGAYLVDQKYLEPLESSEPQESPTPSNSSEHSSLN